jgi:putative transposase
LRRNSTVPNGADHPGARGQSGIEELSVKLARKNSGWGYDRIIGAMANLGHLISDQSVGNILRRHRIPPAPARKKNRTWKDFIRAHLSVMAGTDFFTTEILTWHGLVTYSVLFFVHLDSRRVAIAGMTDHPESGWMEQMAQCDAGRFGISGIPPLSLT